MYGAFENIQIVTLAPELPKTPEVIAKLTELGITVSLGKCDCHLLHRLLQDISNTYL